MRSTSSTRSNMDTKLKIRSIKRSGKKSKKPKEKSSSAKAKSETVDEKKVTPNVIRTKNKKIKKHKHSKKSKKHQVEGEGLDKEMVQKRKINRLSMEQIERSQSDQTHIKPKQISVDIGGKDGGLHRSKSSISTTPSIGPQKGKRIDSIAALIAKKKRKRSVMESDKSAEPNVVNVASQVNKKRKLNEDSGKPVEVNAVVKEENEKLSKSNKKRKKKKSKRKKKEIEAVNVEKDAEDKIAKSVSLTKKNKYKMKKCQSPDVKIKDKQRKKAKEKEISSVQTQTEIGTNALRLKNAVISSVIKNVSTSHKMVQTQKINKQALREKLSLKIPYSNVERLQMISNTLKRINRHQNTKFDVSMTDKFINIVKNNKFVVYPC